MVMTGQLGQDSTDHGELDLTGRGGARRAGAGRDRTGLTCHTRTWVMEAVCSRHDPALKETQHDIISAAVKGLPRHCWYGGTCAASLSLSTQHSTRGEGSTGRRRRENE